MSSKSFKQSLAPPKDSPNEVTIRNSSSEDSPPLVSVSEQLASLGHMGSYARSDLEQQLSDCSLEISLEAEKTEHDQPESDLESISSTEPESSPGDSSEIRKTVNSHNELSLMGDSGPSKIEIKQSLSTRLNREIPIFYLACTKTQETYIHVKKMNPHLKSFLEFAEQKGFAAMDVISSHKYSKPTLEILTDCGHKGLDKLKNHAPIVTQGPEKILKDVFEQIRINIPGVALANAAFSKIGIIRQNTTKTTITILFNQTLQAFYFFTHQVSEFDLWFASSVPVAFLQALRDNIKKEHAASIYINKIKICLQDLQSYSEKVFRQIVQSITAPAFDFTAAAYGFAKEASPHKKLSQLLSQFISFARHYSATIDESNARITKEFTANLEALAEHLSQAWGTFLTNAFKLLEYIPFIRYLTFEQKNATGSSKSVPA